MGRWYFVGLVLGSERRLPGIFLSVPQQPARSAAADFNRHRVGRFIRLFGVSDFHFSVRRVFCQAFKISNNIAKKDILCPSSNLCSVFPNSIHVLRFHLPYIIDRSPDDDGVKLQHRQSGHRRGAEDK